MKPRNKYQQRVVELSNKLPKITLRQEQWAINNCFDKKGLCTRKEIWCTCCGSVFERANNKGQIKCPSCGKLLKLEDSRIRKINKEVYFTILTTAGGFQVCRHFLVHKYIRKGYKPLYEINEVVQNWIDENGKETVIARSTCVFVGIEKFVLTQPMSLKNNSRIRTYTSYYYPKKHNIYSDFIYPNIKLLPKVVRNGFKILNDIIPINAVIKLILSDKEAEMLIKNNQYYLLRRKYERDYGEYEKTEYIHAVKIANKNNYIVEDASIWYDYLDLLMYFNKDTHNAHYVCPDDLIAEHDKLVDKKNRIDRERSLKEKREEIARNEEQYLADKGKFFGVCFGNKDIVITVIKSLEEMEEEGKRLHHCVYVARYYQKKESLILSAKTITGERMETIELSLKTFQVLQCRGKFNQSTDRHNEILELVNKNINLIKKIA